MSDMAKTSAGVCDEELSRKMNDCFERDSLESAYESFCRYGHHEPFTVSYDEFVVYYKSVDCDIEETIDHFHYC
jgi:hypothetical protein